ncbi:hypothetical protein MHC_04165 [Mycoplasma haemocanis str. Illinois]|uniref:Uncharacterized protein n=1 Tax=Mycoplasma haemocanis (strain Illinois) TaxID=1111676 RepID=H6N7R7_MYCHN|nr:hypothetical protein [Mycoplasma haemocanis]AEW45689.1 hypothetical protein MHC_04165 [Mycoplasma haemocanis str. Illinois]
MSKNLILTLGGLGIGGVGAGGLLALRPWKSKVVTFADRYKHSLLDTVKDNSAWDNRYSFLKTIKPKHPTLISAHIEATKTSSSNENEAKRLMKEGCKSIYKSPFENSEYWDDFKNYCSRTNGDASSGKEWNGEDTTSSSGNKWDASLTSLKSHEISNGSLPSVLETLKAEIQSKDSFEKTHRDSLKSWCDGVKKEPFMGPDSLEFRNQELYCKVK